MKNPTKHLELWYADVPAVAGAAASSAMAAGSVAPTSSSAMAAGLVAPGAVEGAAASSAMGDAGSSTSSTAM